MKEEETADLIDLAMSVCRKLLEEHAQLVSAVAEGSASREQLKTLIAQTAEQISLRAGFFRGEIQSSVLDVLFGYGPLQSLIEDDTITDIDGTAPDQFTITRLGNRQFINRLFPDAKAYDTYCRLLVVRNGGVINENDSYCRVADPQYRLRINVTVPPRSQPHPVISIRKHPLQTHNLSDLVRLGMMPHTLADQLAHWANQQRSVLICGKGAAGKTTLLRAWIEAMPPLSRVLIAESDAELYPQKPCCLSLRIKRPDEGGRPVALKDLVRDGLTQSLDAYCIGEVVGEEAYALMQAAFSGHPCLATLHADRVQDVPERLLTLARSAAQGASDTTLRRMLGSGLDLIICLNRFRIEHIAQVHGYQQKEDRYDLETLWSCQPGATADLTAGQ